MPLVVLQGCEHNDGDQAKLDIKQQADTALPVNATTALTKVITPDMLPLINLTQEDIDTIIQQVAYGSANIQDIYSLSPLQEGILFHHIIATKGDPYLTRKCMVFDSKDILDLYLDAYQKVVDRHDILRTGFLWKGLSRSAQVVLQRAKLCITKVELDPINGPVQAQLVKLLDPREHRIDLTQAPLVRFTISQDVDGRWVAVEVMHHLIIDQFSVQQIQIEVQTILNGEGDNLGIPQPYRNLIAETRSIAMIEEHEVFFSRMLAKIDTPTLPYGLSDTQRVEQTEFHLTVSHELVSRLRHRGKSMGVSFSRICHLAWAIVLAATSGQSKVVFGTVVSGRRMSQSASRVLGPFINTLPFCINVKDASLENTLFRVQSELTELVKHQHASLAIAQQYSGVPTGTPLFSSIFNYRRSNDSSLSASGILEMEVQGIQECTNYPISMTVDDSAEVKLICQAARGVNSMHVCQYMEQALKSIAKGLDSVSGASVQELEILPDRERELLLRTWNDTTMSYPDHLCVHHLIEAQASKAPSAVAVVYEGKSFTYKELNDRANQFAHHLINLGVNPDSLVALCVDRSLSMIVSIVAIMKAGGAYVPLDPSFASDRLTSILSDAAPLILVADKTGYEALGGDVMASLTVVDPNSKFDTPAENPVVDDLTTGHLAYVIYTSGSSGKPKGVMVEHRGLTNFAVGHSRSLGIDDTSRVTQFFSFSFDASALEIFSALCFGGVLHVLSDQTRHERNLIWKYFDKHSITHATMAPSALQDCEGLSPLATPLSLVLGGEALPPSLLQTLNVLISNGSVENYYGPTETIIAAVTWRCPKDFQGEMVPIGRPTPNKKVYILDEHGSPVPLGVQGELYIGGEGVARGYLNRPELTSFLPDPFSGKEGARMYKTGDLVRYLPDGNIVFMGRNDHQIKIRGFRVELGEIETRLIEHALVREAAVLTLGSGSDERLVAYVVANHADNLVQTLRDHLASVLPEYMVPAAYVQLDAMPLTSSRKIDRRALPEPDRDAFANQVFEEPQGDTEIALAGIWSDLLKVDRISRHDNFFMLGGHSLLAVRLMNRVLSLGTHLQLSTLLASPTLAELGRVLSNQVYQEEVAPIGIISRDGILSLSFAQKRLWFLDQMEGPSDTYIIPLALRLQGILDVDAWKLSLDTIFARHEAWRTIFVETNGQPHIQLLPASSGLPWIIHDLRGDLDVEKRLVELSNAEASMSFDLKTGPLARSQLIQISEDQYAFLLTQHHIVSDGWSMGLLMKELTKLYNAFSAGQSNPLPPLTIQYPDFAAWQRDRLSGDRLKEQGDFWKKVLVDAPVCIALPTDRARPAQISYAGAQVPIRMDTSTTSALKQLSLQSGSTLFMTIMAAWSAVLARLSGQDDILIGSPSANRNHPDVEQLIGFFINTLVYRVDLSENPTISELLDRVRKCAVSVQANQDLPFEQVVEITQPPRHIDHTPLFQVVFAWQNNNQGDWDLPGLTVSPLDSGYEVAKFDLELGMWELNDEIVGRLTYSTALFDRSTIERHVGYLQAMLKAMVTDVTKSVASVNVLSVEESAQLIGIWNKIRSSVTDFHCLHEMFEAQVAHSPDSTAVVHEDQSLTYGELNEVSNRLAHRLIDLGVKPDTVVALCVERSLAIVIGILAIHKAGGSYLPLDPVYASSRLLDIINDAGPSIVIADALGQKTLGDEALSSLTVINPNAEFETSIENPRVTDLTSSHLAYVIYTSGSTGKPKGVMVEHAQVTRLFESTNHWYDFRSSDTWIMTHSFSFDFSVWEMWGALRYGGKLVVPDLQSIQSSENLYKLVCSEGVSVLNLTPSAFRPLIKYHAEAQGGDRLRYVIMGGESLEPSSLQPWFAIPRALPQVVNMYGITETTVFVSYRVMTVEDVVLSVSPIGCKIPDLTTYILDSHGRPVPLGAVGELWIGGAGVSRGYLNRPELTAERFPLDPFSKVAGAKLYKTGDLARFLPNGDLIYLGRNDHQVKIRGFRIELGEIEARLMDHELVRETFVLALGSDADKILVAYVVADAKDNLAQALRDHLAPLLPDYMVPAAFVRLDCFPLTHNGKLDRRALPEPERDAFASQGSEAPLGEIEVILASIWAELLKIDKVGRFDNFFILGGHSLLAVKMIGQVRIHLGFELRLSTLFDLPTIAMLAVELSGTVANGPQENLLGVIVPLRIHGDRTPLFCMHPVQGLSWCYTGLLDHVPKDQPIYGVQARGLDGVEPMEESIDSMATDYIGEIRKVQPQGPYQLLGWSLGGIVAHAMAAKLEEMGQKVDLLVMLDSSPDPVRDEEWSDEKNEERNLPVKAHYENGPDQYLAKAEEWGLTAEQNEAIRQQWVPIRKNNMRLAKQYSAAMSYSGDLLFFLATVPMLEGMSIVNSQQWKPFVKGTIEVHEIECNHYEMDLTASMAVVGRTLALKLEELYQRRKLGQLDKNNRVPVA
ncbi:hypothetical protein BGZ83_009920 [Gryganskiella cystojenkinii]|nr:hypothetical protein BGZ83_009920 [Gryganskiella cystojenkinii]